MYKQLVIVDDPANSKYYPPAKRDKIYRDIKQLISEEEEIAVASADRERDVRKAAYYEARATTNLDRSLAILGAQQRSNNDNSNSISNRTYILNGRMFNCTSTSNMTTCN
jgi:hypothetical protein